MAQSLSTGKQATFNHARVVYSPFGAGPGAQFVLTADPWSYLTATINQKLAEGTRGANRRRIQRALYFADLAESFAESAKDSSLPASGTLAYYGILNLVKCYLSINGVDLESKLEHHGLSLPLGKKQKILVSKPAKDGLNIFHEFSRLLGKPVTSKGEVSFEDVSGHLPEIHEMAYTLGHLPGSKRGFMPVDIRFLLSDSDDYLFSEVRYEKKQGTRVDTSKFLAGKRKAYFRARYESENYHVHRSLKRKKCSWDSFPRIYSNACKEYSYFDLCSILSPDGYKFYCDLRTPKYHHLAYAFIMMYYIGTAARYRPSEMNDLLDSDQRPIISEALAVIPGQMLYHLVSLCTKRNCVVPHASIAS